MIFALIPAILKTYFNTNEILVSLMLVYVSKLILDYLVVGPWSNPEGFNFPETRQFSDSARMPLLFEGLRIHAGIFIALQQSSSVGLFSIKLIWVFRLKCLV